MTSTAIDRIDSLTTSVAVKAPCRAATTANITLSGLQTIDGVALADGDRVLCKDQTTGSENGIYRARSTAWERAKDFDGNRDVANGTLVRVTTGTANANSWWNVSTPNPITIGTTAIAFAAGISDLDAKVTAAQAAQTAAEAAQSAAETAKAAAEAAEAAAVAAVASVETPKHPTVLKSDDYTLVAGDLGKIIRQDGSNKTFTAFSAVTAGNGWYCYLQQRAGAVNTTVAAPGGQTIDTEASIKLSWSDLGTADPKGVVGGSVLLYSDGADWRTIRMFPPAQKAVMEAAASKGNFVTPGDLHEHPNVVKAGCAFAGASGVVEVGSINVDSVNRTDTGDYVINWTNNFANANYIAHVTAYRAGISEVINFTRAVGSLTITVADNSGTPVDPTSVHVSVLGQLA